MDVSSVFKTPRLAGRALQMAAAVASRGAVAPLVLQQMAQQAGIPGLRALHPRSPMPWAPWPADLPRRRTLRPAVLVRRAARIPWPAAETHPGDVLAIHEAYARGDLRPGDVARRALERVERENDGSHGAHWFISVQPDDVVAQADAADRRWAQGHALSPLDGVPVAIKDEFDVRGYPTTLGTRGLSDGPAAGDAVAVHRLRESGAIFVGKANMHEFGAGVTGINPHYGTPQNPWDASRMPGGSSSGCAAAVAAGVVPLALAADAGGSIRIPAALCGVVGLKPTFGRVSRKGQAELGFTLGHVGVIGATTRDAWLGLAAIAGYDARDRLSAWGPPLELDSRFHLPPRLRVGVDRAWVETADPAVRRVFDAVVEQLAEAGVQIVEVSLSLAKHLFAMHLAVFASEVAASPAVLQPPQTLDLAPDVRLIASVCRAFPGADTVHAGRLRRDLFEAVEGILARCDVLLTPATACTAPTLPADALATGELYLERTERLMRYAVLANLTGHPAAVVRAGLDASGLPVGVQVVGGRWQERLVLGVASLVERGASHDRAPAYRPLLPEQP